jgi:hypothetical protein
VPCTSSATNLYFSDFVEYSPLKTFRLEATSPDNAGKGRNYYHQPFQKDFTYTLFVGNTAEVVWSRRQGKSEVSPVEAFVADSKWAIVRTASESLLLVAPDGEVTATLNVLTDLLSESEREQFTRWTTAGTAWGGLSLWYFVMLRERQHFAILTGWGRRLLIDVERGRRVDEDDESRRLTEALESDFATDILQSAVRCSSAEVIDAAAKVRTAAHIAARMQLCDCVPFLEQLESIEYRGSYVGDLSSVPSGEIGPGLCARNELRQLIQLCLRRLGARSGGQPVTQFFYGSKGSRWVPYRPSPLPTPRETRTELGRAGMTPLQILDVFGPPDFVDWRSEGFWWEYDMDSEPAFTLRVNWGQDRRVMGFERLQPARWLRGVERDMEEFNEVLGGKPLSPLGE